ncbi:MAG: glycosyltransferase family 39 protein [Candidatus Shapirobacteria bacterium]
MKKIALVLLVLLAFSLRLYRINSPLLDWHSWRQADTSAVSRNFVKGGFDLLHPRFDDLSNIASGKDNPAGYRFVEFPFYNFFQAAAYKIFGRFSLEIWGRLVSIVFSLSSLLFLFGIAKYFWGERIAYLSALFWAILPYNVYYGRVILPEPMLVFAGLGMIYFFVKKSIWPSLIFAVIALLLKPFIAVYFLPLAYLAYRRKDRRFFLFIFSFLFLAIWRWWAGHFQVGVPVNLWLLNGNGIRFKGAFFYWLFAERIGRLILGYWGLVLLGFGLAVKRVGKEGLFLLTWLVGVILYLFIVATGNVQHDYYQIILLPVICLYLAKGADYLISTHSYLLLAISFLFMLSFSWYQIRDYFNFNNPVVVEAGRAVDRLVPPNAKVIAPYGGDTAFLYQTNRQGWPVGIEIEKMIDKGAQYYINFNFGPETDWLENTYRVVEKNNRWILIDLTEKK